MAGNLLESKLDKRSEMCLYTVYNGSREQAAEAEERFTEFCTDFT